MALRKILYHPHPVLRAEAKEVTAPSAALDELVRDMIDTMYYENGIGLAAPQIGELQRVIVIDVSENRHEPMALVNPRLVTTSGEVSSEEGCLSIPDYRDTLKRHSSVLVEAVTPAFEPVSVEAEGLLSMCFQHEIDHLNGVLFIDRLSRLKKDLFQRWLRKRQKQEQDESEG